MAQLQDLTGERRVVLTPHPGEFRTLFPDLAGHMELDPWDAAAQAADQVGATVILKGAPSVVATSGSRPVTVVAGNPGLATGGSGDVMSGLIGAFMGQALDPLRAAALGAQALGRSADLAGKRSGTRGLRPMDVIATLPDLWREWSRSPGAAAAPHPPILFDLPRPLST